MQSWVYVYKVSVEDIKMIRREINLKARTSTDGGMNKFPWHFHLKITSYNIMKPLENVTLYFSFTVAHYTFSLSYLNKNI